MNMSLRRTIVLGLASFCLLYMSVITLLQRVPPIQDPVSLATLLIAAGVLGAMCTGKEALAISLPLVITGSLAWSGGWPLIPAALVLLLACLAGVAVRRRGSGVPAATQVHVQLLLLAGAVIFPALPMLLFASGIPMVLGAGLLLVAAVLTATALYQLGRRVTLLEVLLTGLPVSFTTAMLSLYGWTLGHAMQSPAGVRPDDPWPQQMGPVLTLLVLYPVIVGCQLIGYWRAKAPSGHSDAAPKTPVDTPQVGEDRA